MAHSAWQSHSVQPVIVHPPSFETPDLQGEVTNNDRIRCWVVDASLYEENNLSMVIVSIYDPEFLPNAATGKQFDFELWSFQFCSQVAKHTQNPGEHADGYPFQEVNRCAMALNPLSQVSQ